MLLARQEIIAPSIGYVRNCLEAALATETLVSFNDTRFYVAHDVLEITDMTALTFRSW